VRALTTATRVVTVVQEVEGGRVETGGNGVVEVDSFAGLEIVSGVFLGLSAI